MNETLITTGIACLIAAIAGGGLKAFGIEIPLLKSTSRQILLALFGGLLMIIPVFKSSDMTELDIGSIQTKTQYTGMDVRQMAKACQLLNVLLVNADNYDAESIIGSFELFRPQIENKKFVSYTFGDYTGYTKGRVLLELKEKLTLMRKDLNYAMSVVLEMKFYTVRDFEQMTLDEIWEIVKNENIE